MRNCDGWHYNTFEICIILWCKLIKAILGTHDEEISPTIGIPNWDVKSPAYEAAVDAMIWRRKTKNLKWILSSRIYSPNSKPKWACCI